MTNDDHAADGKPSKTRVKQDMHALQALGAALVDLPATRLAKVEMPENLRDAVAEARRIHRREARRRQLQYIGRLMRDIDPAPIKATLDAMNGTSRAETARLHRAERWRDRLLDDDAALTEFARECAGTDLQALRACLREARKERGKESPARHYRELFRLVRAALERPGPDEAASV